MANDWSCIRSRQDSILSTMAWDGEDGREVEEGGVEVRIDCLGCSITECTSVLGSDEVRECILDLRM